jgi:hypothetical protein
MHKGTRDKQHDHLTRRELLGFAGTLTGAGLAAASIGLPQSKASPKQETALEPLEDFKVLLVFNSPDYQEINISIWLAAKPAHLLADNFGISEEVVAKLPRQAISFAAKVA